MNDQRTSTKILVELDTSDTKPGFAILRLVDWDYLATDDEIGLRARCEDGSWQSIAEKLPSYADYHGIEFSVGTPLRQIKAQSCAEFGCEEEELPWLTFGAGSEVLAESDSLEAAKAWLNKPIDMSQDQYCDYGNHGVTEYAPGFALANCASAEEREELSVQEVDLGGPASSVPCIVVKDAPELIAAFLERHALDYVIQNI